ncbi:unnamed protein product [Adineta steineri]|uniref:Nucleotidyl transferase domain-containing protein n=5 Tax=Adineta steineri TaxID=433720 RepID=A0A815MP59_9BILA|nr:unnamed protein product [Adineta steineri]CAF3893280.1 unnamed protein product [Adineta steineri]
MTSTKIGIDGKGEDAERVILTGSSPQNELERMNSSIYSGMNDAGFLCIILCGGEGSRFQDQMWPKPMNLVDGKPLFVWNIQSIIHNIPSCRQLAIFHNTVLSKYAFPSLVKWWFPNIPIHFVEVPYLTRGAAETLFVGINQLITKNPELHSVSILVCDNDIAISAPLSLDICNKDPFLVVQYNTEPDPIYSYVQAIDNVTSSNHNPFHVRDVHEKVKVSDWICVGIYGFPSASFAIEQTRELLKTRTSNNNEYYLSHLYTTMCARHLVVRAIPTTNICILGTPSNIRDNGSAVWNLDVPATKKKLRVVFDLDNTLVSYPQIPGDYSTVLPIEHTINWTRALKAEGHTIIVYTARRMDTHKSNVGKVIADIARVTFDTLDKFGIPYDEIIFGKPIGDIYIDDRAINPWDPSAAKGMGFYRYSEMTHTPHGMSGTPFLQCTSHNHHALYSNNVVLKEGPTTALQGEAYFYQKLQENSQMASIKNYFPTFYGIEQKGEKISAMKLQYVKGVPMSLIYFHSVVSTDLFYRILTSADAIHNVNLPLCENLDQHIRANYIDKMVDRFRNHPEHYSFVPENERDMVFTTLLSKLEEYLNSNRLKRSSCIHGDFWFANILAEGDKHVKFIDMKGSLWNFLSTCGDPIYDWAKLYQSIVGFDNVVVFHKIDHKNLSRESLTNQLKSFIEERGYSWPDVRLISAVLMFGVYWAVDSLLDDNLKIALWKIICLEADISTNL